MDVTRIIGDAIAVGAPMFNKGDAAGCATLYADCAADLLADGNLPKDLRQRLTLGLEQASSSGASARDRAWAMRHALDSVLEASTSGVVSQSSGSMVDFSDRSITWTVVDDRVSTCCTHIHGCPSVALAAVH
jgi:hypothetical protein